MALELRRADRCQINAPEWMTVDGLQKVLADEQSSPLFSSLPLRYMEVASQLLATASADFRDATELATLLEDIYNQRASKIRRGLHGLKEDTSAVKLNNIGSMELNVIRPFLAFEMDVLSELTRAESTLIEQARGGGGASGTSSGVGSGAGLGGGGGGGDLRSAASSSPSYAASSSSSSSPSAASPSSSSSGGGGGRKGRLRRGNRGDSQIND